MPISVTSEKVSLSGVITPTTQTTSATDTDTSVFANTSKADNTEPKSKLELTKDGAKKTTYDSDGKIKTEESLNADGKTTSKTMYEKGSKLSTLDYDSAGNIVHNTFYDGNGAKKSENFFKDKLLASQIKYDKNGKVLDEVTYQPSSDKMSWTKSSETKYKDGQKTVEQTYDKDAGLTHETFYKDGKVTDSKDYKFGVKIDGEIGDVKQGSMGDCWLVAGLTALSTNEETKKAIKDSISQDSKTGNVTVTLKGAHESYTFTPDEIKYRDDLSSGDDDARVIEMAVEQHRKKLLKEGNGEMQKDAAKGVDNCREGNGSEDLCKMQQVKPLTGGEFTEIFYDITGKTGVRTDQHPEVDPNKILEDYQKDPSASVLTCGFEQEKEIAVTKDSSGRFVMSEPTSDDPNFKLLLDHAYIVVKVTDTEVTVVNPHDTSKIETISRDLLLKHKPTLTYLNTKE